MVWNYKCSINEKFIDQLLSALRNLDASNLVGILKIYYQIEEDVGINS